MKKRPGFNLNPKAVGFAVLAAATLPAFAADGNLSSVVPTSFVGSWFWAAAGLVIGAVVAVKGVQIIIRLIRRV